jgi:hypothetical protein
LWYRAPSMPLRQRRKCRTGNVERCGSTCLLLCSSPHTAKSAVYMSEATGNAPGARRDRGKGSVGDPTRRQGRLVLRGLCTSGRADTECRRKCRDLRTPRTLRGGIRSETLRIRDEARDASHTFAVCHVASRPRTSLGPRAAQRVPAAALLTSRARTRGSPRPPACTWSRASQASWRLPVRGKDDAGSEHSGKPST